MKEVRGAVDLTDYSETKDKAGVIVARRIEDGWRRR
jgi:hypothetical protein